MVAAGPRLDGPLLGVERQTFRDRCVHGCGDGMSSNTRRASREDLPGFDGSFGHVDASLHAAVVARSSAAHGTDRGQVLAYPWLGADCVRWFTQHGAANQVQ